MIKPLSRMLRAIDGLFIFHPSRWPQRESAGRITAFVCVAVLLFVKWHRFQVYPGSFEAFERFFLSVNSGLLIPVFTSQKIHFLWWLRILSWTAETGTLAGYLLAYAVRKEASVPAGGFRETLVPVLVAALPVAISMTPYTFAHMIPYSSPVHFPVFASVSIVILLGTLINLLALLTLRYCFSIMPEARGLVTTGLFRYVRHPIYLGHFILMSGVVLIRLHWYTVILFILFCAGQYWRALLEEEKLSRAVEGYAEYKMRTGMFLPSL